MKKILSLCLALVMLLGMVSMTVSAEGEAPAYDGYSVSLGDDIALNFYFANLDAAVAYTATINGEAADVVVDGTTGTVKVTALTPAMIEDQFTVALLADGQAVATSAPKSVKDYCAWALTNMALSNDVHTLIVNLLDYAAAAQAFTGADATANAWLSDLQKALAVAGDAAVKPNEEVADNNYLIRWLSVAPILGESIAYRYYFTIGTEGLLEESITFDVVVEGGETYTIQGSEAVAAVVEEVACYYIDFTDLTPADLRKDVTITAKLSGTSNASATKVFSAERYATWATTRNDEKLNNLMNAILAYNKAAINYNNDPAAEHLFANQIARDVAAGVLTAAEQYRISQITDNTPAQVKSYWNYLAEWVYDRAGVNIVGFAKQGHDDFVKQLFPMVDTTRVLNTSCYHYDMLVPGSYGGTSLDSSVTGGGVLAAEDFQIGDIAVWKTSSRYYSACYLGNDRFMQIRGHSKNAFGGTIVTYSDLTSGATNSLTASTNVYYFVLRPSKLNYRSMSAYALTDEEKTIISGLKVEDFKGYNLYMFFPWVYSQIGVSVSNADNVLLLGSNADITSSLFPKSGGYVLNTDSKFIDMVVSESYGGSKLAAEDQHILPLDKYEVGDILCTGDGSSYKYYSCLYQGEGKFLVVTHGEGNSVKTYDELAELFTSASIYLVLRPSQLAN